VEIKTIESKTKHDLNAITTFIKKFIIKKYPHVKEKQLALIHIGLTSQDANSLGFMIGFQGGINHVVSTLQKFIDASEKLVDRTRGIVMMSRTHGQPAPATDFSKELYVHHHQISDKKTKLSGSVSDRKLTAKFGGAVGNMNAFQIISDKINWLDFADKFVEMFGFKRSQFTTQIDDYSSVTDTLDIIADISNDLQSYCENLWLYIRDSYLLQEVVRDEVGSSTMPQKVNPISFEKAETCFEMCVSTINAIKKTLRVTCRRYQRTISDSYATRTISVALGYFVVGIVSMTEGIKRLVPNTKHIAEDLQKHPEIIMEGIQTGMRLAGIDNAYETAKDFSRKTEQDITLEQIRNFVEKQNITDPELKKKLLELTPQTYIGTIPEF
jgi:adenylosuccinate lyase